MSTPKNDPGAWVPPFPIKILEQLQAVSDELAALLKEHPELVDAKSDVDRAISRLSSLQTTE